MKKLLSLVALLLVLVLGTATALSTSDSASANGHGFPDIISLPDGFQPEGIAIGRGTNFYVGSLGTLGDDGVTITGGAIYKGSLRTGEGDILVQPQEGRTAVGLTVDRRTNYVYAAGGPFGNAHVYNGRTGAEIATIQLTNVAPFSAFINDVIVGPDAAYFTDSFQPVIYKVALMPRGRIPASPAVQTLSLGGDFDFVPGGFNGNGIAVTRGGRWLILVNTATGTLYRVNPNSGYATEINLDGDSVPNGDGIILNGRTLYVVQNFLNQITKIRLDFDFDSGTVISTITDQDFQIPTTADDFGRSIYVVNARFDVAPPPFPGNPQADPTLEYQVVRVNKR